MAKTLYPGSICDVHGIRAGHAQDEEARTGVTVILCAGDGATGGVSVRGAAPITKETDLLRPESLVEKVNAVVLSGGSAYGLESACGVMRYLEQMDAGMDMGVCRVPIVPAAVLFDLSDGNPFVRPDAMMGREACVNAGKTFLQGSVGVGCGATVGKLVPGTVPQRGGVGSASVTLPEGVTVGAAVAVNACGDVFHPRTGKPLGCGHMPDGTPVLCEDLLFGQAPVPASLRGLPGSNTTIGCIAVDCKLTKTQANRLADVAQDGLARTIRPVHTQMDGDTLFALATGRVNSEMNFVKLCMAAAEVTARAIANAILAVKV